MKGRRKVVRTQNREIRIVRLFIFVRMTVHDGERVVIIFLADEAAGVLAERAHLVFKRLRIADQLGFVEDVVDFLHHLVAHFHAHADIHSARRMRDAVFFTHPFQPVRAPPAGRHDDPLRRNRFLSPLTDDVCARTNAVFDDEIRTVGGK